MPVPRKGCEPDESESQKPDPENTENWIPSQH